MKADLSSSKVVERIGNNSNGDAYAWWSWNAVLVEYQQMPPSALPGLLPSQFVFVFVFMLVFVVVLVFAFVLVLVFEFVFVRACICICISICMKYLYLCLYLY